MSITAGQANPVMLVPGAAPVDVDSTASIAIKFDRYLLPPTAVRASVCLQSSLDELASATDCKSQLGQLGVQYDPVTRTMTLYLNAPMPEGAYKLTLFTAAASDSGAGFRAFDGAALEKTQAQESVPGKYLSVVFNAKDATPIGSPETPPPSPPFCAAPDGPLCTPSCVGTGYKDPLTEHAGAGQVLFKLCGGICHVDISSPVAPPAMGLQLDSALAVQATAVGKVAHQSEMGGRADLATENPARFGVSMARIGADPGNSYMIYKLLVNADAATWDSTLAPGETDRLRRTVVVGMPMPAAGPNVGDVSLAEVEVLSQWILGGATIRPCELGTQ